MEKNALRKNYIQIRKEITEKEEKSILIKENLKTLEEYKTANKIGIYYSMENEVDTKEIIKDLLDSKKEVYLPKVLEDTMDFFRIESLDFEKEKSSFGVIEPIFDKEKLLKGNLDIIIIPGICFDMNKNRIGYGKGFYDKYLDGKNIKKISICFDKQLLINDTIHTSTYDKKMDIVVTEKRIF